MKVHALCVTIIALACAAPAQAQAPSTTEPPDTEDPPTSTVPGTPIIIYVQGPPGEPGPPGDNGQDGADGRDGLDGQDGQDGLDGQDALDAPLVAPKLTAPRCTTGRIFTITLPRSYASRKRVVGTVAGRQRSLKVSRRTVRIDLRHRHGKVGVTIRLAGHPTVRRTFTLCGTQS